MKFDLKTTITAYPKVSPSVLAGYVTEAPVDGKTYARKDAQWVEIRPADLMLYYGASKNSVMTVGGLLALERQKLDYKSQAVNISFASTATQKEGGSYLWFCCSAPIVSILQADVANICIDYKLVNKIAVARDNNTESTIVYCYRTNTPQLPYRWHFTLNIDIDEVISDKDCPLIDDMLPTAPGYPIAPAPTGTIPPIISPTGGPTGSPTFPNIGVPKE